VAAVSGDPAKAPEQLHASVAQGLEVVAKIKLWPTHPPVPLATPAPAAVPPPQSKQPKA